jgi:hypothetical protein
MVATPGSDPALLNASPTTTKLLAARFPAVGCDAVSFLPLNQREPF